MTSKSDVDLRANIYPEFPAGWNSATDLMEGFLLAAALELRARQQLLPSDPWADEVFSHLPARYRYDPFGQLLSNGPYSDSDRNQVPVSLDPTINYLLHERRATSGERIGRLPLLAVVWQFTTQVLEEYEHLRRGDRSAGYSEALRRLGGRALGQYGTALFMAAFEREWFAEDSTQLSPAESAFLAAEDLRVGSGILSPHGSAYAKSIWLTSFRLIERRSPEYYISLLEHRQGVVDNILDRGANLGIMGATSIWPGWPTPSLQQSISEPSSPSREPRSADVPDSSRPPNEPPPTGQETDTDATAAPISDPFERASALAGSAEALAVAGEGPAARKAANRARAAADTIADPVKRTEALVRAAEALATAGDVDAARKAANRAHYTANTIASPTLRGEARLRVAEVLGRISSRRPADPQPAPEVPEPSMDRATQGPATEFVAVAASGSLSAALRADGTLVAWGAFGFEGRAFVPEGLENVKAVAVGPRHCVAVRGDGTVTAWGVDEFGVLDVPAGLSGVESVAACSGHNLALKGDGTVVAWGDNSDGVCDVPTGLCDVVDIAIANGHSVAVKRDGRVIAWGKNRELLEGTEGLSDVLSVSGLTAVKRDGTVVTLGRPGQSTYGSTLVQAPPGLSGVIAAAGEGSARFGLLEGGTVIAWGFVEGEMAVPGDLAGVVAVAAGDHHVLALKADGTIVAWGENWAGQTDVPSQETLSVPSDTHGRRFPGPVEQGANSSRFISVAAGREHSLGLKAEGTVVAWGSNRRGQLDVPKGLSGAIAIDAGEHHSIALLSDGTVVTWGGTVGGPVDQPDGLDDVTAVAAGGDLNLALRSDGSVVLWRQSYESAMDLPADWTDIVSIGMGGNGFGGHPIALTRDGQVLLRQSMIGPGPAPSWLHSVSSVACTESLGYALQADGTLVEWGSNSWPHPSEVGFASPVGVVTVAAGPSHALALKADGTVVGWGYNADGQAAVPAGLVAVVAISAGQTHSLAVTDDGAIVGWGSNADGQLDVPRPGDDGTDSSASRIVLDLVFRTKKARAGSRPFMFSLNDPTSAQEPKWFLGGRTGEGDLQEDSPVFATIAGMFYTHLAFDLLQNHLPSFRWDRDVTSALNDTSHPELPIVVRGKVSVRRQELDDFRAAQDRLNRPGWP